jgi:hypothetical protein
MALWALVQRRVHWADMLELRELTAKGKQGDLTSSEDKRLRELLDVYDTFVLYRSVALRLLKERGENWVRSGWHPPKFD